MAETIQSPSPESQRVVHPHKDLISLREIWKTYDMGDFLVHALKNVSVEILEGEFVAIMGPSGSGKSTMMNLLGCLDRPTKGTYLLDGTDVSTFSAAQRADVRNQKVGFVFQNFNLLPRTSVWENVEAPMLYLGIPRAERVKRIEETLRIVGIPEKAKALTNQLSGGQQQRVALARALVNQPVILLADEPTGNLDSLTSSEILRFLQDLNLERGITLIMVTHDEKIAGYASRVIHMIDGDILRDSSQQNTSHTAEFGK